MGLNVSNTNLLCQNCQAIPFDIFYQKSAQYTLFNSSEELKESADAGCHTCVLFCASLVYVSSGGDRVGLSQWPDEDRPVLLTSYRAGKAIAVRSGGLIAVCAINTLHGNEENPGNTSSIKDFSNIDVPLFMALAPAPDAEENISFLKKWIDQCAHNHPFCKISQRYTSNTLPTRLVDVGAADNSAHVRLVDGMECRSGRYLTLSHCWGPTPIDATWKTTTKNIECMKCVIPVQILPRTFREAVEFTRRLGERYIWIDSLCIIQDSIADWEKEATSMSEVYSGALCMLDAFSDHSEGGLFVARTSLEYEPAQFTNGTTSTHTDESDRTMLLPAVPHTPQFSRPTQKRAWCLQEQELSPRTISFTTHQIFFNCFSQATTEVNFRMGEKPSAARLRVGMDVKEYNDFHGYHWATEAADNLVQPYLIWYHAVENFSQRELTNATDKLPAISGLARKQQRLISGVYLAGLWENDLICGLMWMTYPNCVRYDEYIAPSWSWASIKGGVSHDLIRSDSVQTLSGPSVQHGKFRATVQTFDVQLAGEDPYGRIRSIELVLRATVKQARCGQLHQVTSRRQMTLLDLKTGARIGDLDPDDDRDISGGMVVTCLSLSLWNCSEEGFSGLALVPVHSGEDVVKYSRVGYLSGIRTAWLAECEPSIVTLV